jgi:magnesium-protoporphyrin IX monomethyl ester (oxidative) cyclase
LVSQDVRLSWDTPNGVRADTLNDDLMENMKKSGCVNLVVAAESGNQDVVTHIVKKKLDLKSILKAVELGKKHGIPMACFFVIGFPGETKKNISSTFDFAAKLYARYNCHPILNLATPLPGTELAHLAQYHRYLIHDLSPANLAVGTSIYGHGMIKTPEFDPEYLRRSAVRFDARIEHIRRLKRAAFLLTHPDELFAFVQRRISRQDPAHSE